MYNIIISIFTNLVRLLITRRFIGIFFDVKSTEKMRELGGYTLFFIITMGCHLAFHQPIINIITNLLGLFLIMLLYSNNIKKNIFITLAIYAVCMLCDSIAVFSFINYKIGDEINEIYTIFTVILILAAELITERIVHRKRKDEFMTNHWMVLLSVPVISLIMLYVLVENSQRERYLMMIESIGILFINIIVFYLYNAILNEYTQQREKDTLRQQIEFYENQLEVITDSQKKIYSLQHDLKHHIKELYSRAHKSDVKPVMEYLDKMKDFMDNPKEYVYSGNWEIDGILNYMLQKAHSILKKVEVKLNVPEDFDLRSFELNVILGNLLENAIEAASHSRDKMLFINLEMEKGILFIDISNSYQGEIEKKEDRFKTSKKDKERHGYGLENVRKIVDLNSGSIKTGYDEQLFCINIMLYILKVI